MFYNHYAYKVEFSVRKGNETKKNRVIHWKKKLFVLRNEKRMRHGGKKKKKKEKKCTLKEREQENIQTYC